MTNAAPDPEENQQAQTAPQEKRARGALARQEIEPASWGEYNEVSRSVHVLSLVRKSAHYYATVERRPPGVVCPATLADNSPSPPEMEESGAVAAATAGSATPMRSKIPALTLSLKQANRPYIFQVLMPQLEDVKCDDGVYRYIATDIDMQDLKVPSGCPVTEITCTPLTTDTPMCGVLDQQTAAIKLAMVQYDPLVPPEIKLMQEFVELQMLALLPDLASIATWFVLVPDSAGSHWVHSNLLTTPYFPAVLRGAKIKRCLMDSTDANKLQMHFEMVWGNVHAAERDEMYAGIPPFQCRTLAVEDDIPWDSVRRDASVHGGKTYGVTGTLTWSGYLIFIPFYAQS